jgi:DMATS type aromatic prenyltransferase
MLVPSGNALPPGLASRVDALDADDEQCETDRMQWAALLGPHLAHALEASEAYTQSDMEAHLAFFRDHVCGWLGSAPAGQPLRPAYLSALTCDGTPLELSYSGGSSSSSATVAVRYVVDVVARAGRRTRLASLAAAQGALEGLRGAADGLRGYRVDVLPDVWAAVAARLAQWEHSLHAAAHCDACSPSSTFVGFDLAGEGCARGKLYWLLPACLSAPGLLALLDDVFGLLPAAAGHWAPVRRHLAAHAGSVLRPRMLSIDATRCPAARVKLYSRCHFDSHASFTAAVEPHLTLDGAVPLPPHSHHAALWARLLARYRLETPSQPRYCMVVHDMLPPAPLRSKLYWFAHQMPYRDALIVGEFLADVAQPTALLRRQLLAGHLSDHSTFIKEIGIAQRDGALDIAAYISPALFSA